MFTNEQLTKAIANLFSIVGNVDAKRDELQELVNGLEEMLNKNCSDVLNLEKRIEELERKNN